MLVFWKWIKFRFKQNYFFIVVSLQKELSKTVQPNMIVFTYDYDFWYSGPGYRFNVLARKNILDEDQKYVVVISDW